MQCLPWWSCVTHHGAVYHPARCLHSSGGKISGWVLCSASHEESAGLHSHPGFGVFFHIHPHCWQDSGSGCCTSGVPTGLLHGPLLSPHGCSVLKGQQEPAGTTGCCLSVKVRPIRDHLPSDEQTTDLDDICQMPSPMPPNRS